MSADYLLLLPTSILTEIWDFCTAKDIVTLICTCRSLKSLMEQTMLVIDGSFRFGDTTTKLPVFVSENCHSVFLVCTMQQYWDRHKCTMVIRSRSKHHKGPFSTEVCRHEKIDNGDSLVFHIGFLYDPSAIKCFFRL